ncbi:MAG: histidine phosphatase family protein [Alphaproteobacteria bacterium]|nr:MAG: histidine phosphatase family protein [Alphaproteobacteria bacterium]
MIGWTDLPADLSDTARIARLGTFLPRAPIAWSDLRRAAATAAAIAGDRPRLGPDPRLRELHFGAWEGRRFDELGEDEALRLRRFYEDPGDRAPPGGESWNLFRARITAAIADLRKRARRRAAPDGGETDLVIVAHMGVIMAAIELAGDLPAGSAFGHVIEPLSVTRTRHADTAGGVDFVGTEI